MNKEITGQFLGHIEGTNQGHIVFNLEYENGELRGSLRVRDANEAMPSFVTDISAKLIANSFSFEGTNIRAIDPLSYTEMTNTDFTHSYPEITFPQIISGSGKFSNGEIEGAWQTDISTKGNFSVRTYYGPATETTSSVLQWSAFRERLTQFSSDSFIFRGQGSNKWGLRTKFHRSGRSNLLRYFKEDVPKLYRLVHAETGLKFDLNCNEDLGALLYLAQHHGYPTPLLDWSCSPYVAAYFAFRDVDETAEEYARIYVLDKSRWGADTYQTEQYRTHEMTISYSELLASGNKRAIPQQAVTTFSTVDWIEGYFAHKSKSGEVQYLTSFDIAVSEKNTVLEELRQMGITEASLFPGLDGICKDLSSRYFA